MKTVKIPECMNPFEVIVNNNRYRYPGGTEQEVPDEVAEVIEVHMKNHADMTAPPYVPGGGGGGATCKLVVNAVDEGMGVSGTLYLSTVDNAIVGFKDGTTEYDVPCGSLVYFTTFASGIYTENMTEISYDSDYGRFVYRVPSTAGAVGTLNLSFM